MRGLEATTGHADADLARVSPLASAHVIPAVIAARLAATVLVVRELGRVPSSAPAAVAGVAARLAAAVLVVRELGRVPSSVLTAVAAVAARLAAGRVRARRRPRSPASPRGSPPPSWPPAA